MIKTNILKLSSKEQDCQIIQQAAQILNEGGIISFPTETVYALGADAFNCKAVEKVSQLKGRKTDRPFAIFLSDDSGLGQFVESISSPARKLIEEFLPGPLTLVFKSKADKLVHLTSVENKLGVRISSSRVIQSLLSKTRRPITATSANLSGYKDSISAEDVYKYFNGRIELILDGGSAEESVPSSVVDVSDDMPILIREGRISFEELKNVLPGIKRVK